MFRSRAVAKVKPSNSCRMVLILGKGNGFLIGLLFSSLNSVKNHTFPFFFGWIKDNAAYSDNGCHSNTPNSMRCFISFMMVSLWTFGIVNAQPLYGLAHPSSSKETDVVFQVPNVPSNNGLKSVSNSSNIFFLQEFRWLQLSTTVWRSAFCG